jgi:hypothetical protein
MTYAVAGAIASIPFFAMDLFDPLDSIVVDLMGDDVPIVAWPRRSSAR